MLNKQVENLLTYADFKIRDYVKRRILAQKKSEGLAGRIQSLQIAWTPFGDMLEALKKYIPDMKKASRKGERLLNSRIKQIIKTRRHPSKS